MRAVEPDTAVSQEDVRARAAALALAYSQAALRQDDFARAERVDKLLADLGLDEVSRAAAYVFIGLPAPERDRETLLKAFGPPLLSLVEGLDRASHIERLNVARTKEGSGAKLDAKAIEGIRKMLLAMAEDVRVVLIKLAERVDFMRSLVKAPLDVQQSAARQTMELFAPLANRLGLSQLKWELEDFAFRFLEPELYKRIARLLDEKRGDRERFIAEVIGTLSRTLRDLGIVADFSGRPKHIYSIYRKMKGKGVDFEQVYDVRAVRVIVESVRDCYTVLGVIHDHFAPIDGEFDDYIAQPKANNYRSLHTAVIGPGGRTLEVQVRTKEMHEFNEHGVAAHWRYKEGPGSARDKAFDGKIAWLRQMLEFREDLSEHGRIGHDSARGLFEDTIYVLTPQGKVVDLPRGSTAVDFAYHLHTDLGHRCRGAKVDGHMVPLTYALQNAQKVEITAVKTGGPSRDWLSPHLGYLHTPRALSKVRTWFKQQQHELDLGVGRTVLEKELQRLGRTNEKHERIAAALGYPGIEELLIALARGEVTHHQFDVALGREVKTETARPNLFTDLPRVDTASNDTRRSSGVMVLGVNNLATMVAKCCKPLPPDPIVGFVAKARGVVVHRADCPNIVGLSPDQRERLMPADWGLANGALFSAEIEVVANDRQGLLRDISDAISREKVNVVAVNTISRGINAFMRFTVQVTDREIIERLRRGVLAVGGVYSVTRR
jgi:GTP pyrophosphokinase